MKHWTQRYPRSGNATEPDALNGELRAQQSSITTLDRSQVPTLLADENNLEDGALLRCWSDRLYPSVASSGGEQQAGADTTIASNAWACLTYQEFAGGWTSLQTPITLSGFQGGQLYVEWSGNAYQMPAFADGASNLYPGSPRYVGLRVLVNGVPLGTRRGTGYHEHFRVIGTGRFAAGDLTVDFQFKPTEIGTDDPIEDSSSNHVPQCHLYANRYFIQGRWR